MSVPAPRLVVLGLSHRTAPVGQREKAALDADGLRSLLRTLASRPGVSEAAAVSTCNRTEVYLVCDDAEHGKAAAADALVGASRISAAELRCAHYALYEEHAVSHLFRVTAGLDSMVLGESEVQGQVRAAAELAGEEGTLGPLLCRLFRQALTAGGRVRRETRVSGGPTSVASAAVDVALHVFPDLSDQRVLLVGAGRMAESTGRALRRRGARELAVANRTISAARELADALGGRAVELHELAEELAWADMVVSSTDAPHPVIHREDVARALALRPDRPLALLDLAVPRDVDAGVGSVRGALLYDIDDLERTMRQSADGRRRELVRAERIVADETAHFSAWRNALAVAPTIEALHLRAEEIRSAELARAGRALEPFQLERLDAITRAVVTKLLHEPTVRLRGSASLAHAGAIRHLFALDECAAQGEQGADVVPLRAAG